MYEIETRVYYFNLVFLYRSTDDFLKNKDLGNDKDINDESEDDLMKMKMNLKETPGVSFII